MLSYAKINRKLITDFKLLDNCIASGLITLTFRIILLLSNLSSMGLSDNNQCTTEENIIISTDRVFHYLSKKRTTKKQKANEGC